MKFYRYMLNLLLLAVFALPVKAQGSGDAISFSANNFLNSSGGLSTLNYPLTLEYWIYLDDNSGFEQIFTSEYTTGTYNGIFSNITSTGRRANIAFGDGGSVSISSRRSITSVDPVQTGRWTHIAFVVRDPLDGDIYFNGVPQEVEYSGFGSLTLGHNSFSAVTIGFNGNNSVFQFLDGDLDELRLWSEARTIDQIRDNMCLEADPTDPTLIAYWNFNEGMGSSTEDLAGAKVANFLGSPDWITSGAAIGNESVHEYASSLAMTDISLGSPAGDRLRVNNIFSDPDHGVQLYRVDSIPNSLMGLAATPTHYWGTFISDLDVTYDAIYEVDGTPCVQCTQNFYSRENNIDPNWQSLIPFDTRNCALQFNLESSIGISNHAEYVGEFDTTVLGDIILNYDTLICNTDSILFYGQWISAAGIFTTSLDAGDNCDSVITFTVGTTGCTTEPEEPEIDSTCAIYIPNAFTPNSDGLNDYFKPVIGLGISPDDYEMQIFNRWGALIFQTEDINVGWDGTFKGQEQLLETYIVYVRFRSDLLGCMISEKRAVILLR